ncbi:MAG TPA: hypothetical protein VFK04_15515 [Gemmatimonadaceae bacterium]|nr:hypothetical protein [Gemmatimonadaceae bacterium]
MSWHLSRRWTAIAVALGAVFVAVNWIGRRREYRTVAGVEATLGAAGVRPGVGAERVFAVLDSLRANYSALASDGVVTVSFGRSFSDLFVRGDIAGRFEFDTAGRLVSREVRENLTGP